MDDGSVDGKGLGFDNTAAGSIIYMDKLVDHYNNWVFESVDMRSYVLNLLKSAYDEAKAFYDKINVDTEVAGEGEGDVVLKYSYDHYANLGLAIGSAGDIIDAGASYTGTVDDMQAALNALTAARAACVKFYVLNQLENGEYFIKLGSFYLHNYGVITDNLQTTVGHGLATDMILDDASEIFTVAKVSGVDKTTAIDRYSIFSVTNTAVNLAENGRLRTSWGSTDNDYRTMNIYYDGTKCAIQCAGLSSSKGFLYLSASNELINNASYTTLEPTRDFVFELTNVKTLFAQKVAEGRTVFNAAVIGSETGQYKQSVYDDFKTALESAEAKNNAGTATSSDLITYVAARNLFLANDQTTINDISGNGIKVIGGIRNIRVITNEPENIQIYNLTGMLIYNSEITGTQDILVKQGCYIVRAQNSAAKIIVK